VAAVDNGGRDSVRRVHQQQEAHLGRQALLIVVHEVADHLHAGKAYGRAERPAQHVEVTVGDPRLKMHSGLDHRLAAPLRREAGFDRRDDLAVRELERLDVERVQIGEIERLHRKLSVDRLAINGPRSPESIRRR
jgi:hypothetical protein